MSFYDQFTTRAMLEAFAEEPRTSSFLRDMFFSRTQTFPTQEVEIDFYFGKRRLAPFVAPYQGGRALLREGFRSQIHRPPRFAPERLLPAEDFLLRGIGSPGAFSTAGPGPEDMIAATLQRDRQECDAAITMREEELIKQVLTTGGIRLFADGGAEFALVFAPHVAANLPIPWTQENADPLGDLALMQAAVRTRSGINPNVAILSSDAGAAFMQSARVRAWMNYLNARIGRIDPQVSEDGTSAMIGQFLYPQIEIWIYDNYYLRYDPEAIDPVNNPTGEVSTPMLPSGTVIVLSSHHPGTMVYGGIGQLEPSGAEMVHQAERVPLIITDVDNQVRKFRLSSRPLPVPINALGYAVANALGNGEDGPPEPSWPDIPRPFVPSAPTDTESRAAKASK